MRFGDLIVKQLSRIAMGMSPAPTIANSYMAIYEQSHVLQYIPQVVLYLCRFIDDGLGIGYMTQTPKLMRRTGRIFKPA